MAGCFELALGRGQPNRMYELDFLNVRLGTVYPSISRLICDFLWAHSAKDEAFSGTTPNAVVTLQR